jgi:hypothetical protein
VSDLLKMYYQDGGPILAPLKRGPAGSLFNFASSVFGGDPEVNYRAATPEETQSPGIANDPVMPPPPPPPPAPGFMGPGTEMPVDTGVMFDRPRPRPRPLNLVPGGPRRWEPGAIDAQRSQMAPTVNPNGMEEPDWEQRPEGEAEKEGLFYEIMMRQGQYAPKHITNEWADIQSRKQQRINKRADYNAQLIRDQFVGDLSRRNQEDQLLSNEAVNAARNITQVRNTQAELDYRRRQDSIQNALRAKQIEADMAGAQMRANEESFRDRLAVAKQFYEPTQNIIKNATSLTNLQSLIIGDADEIGVGPWNIDDSMAAWIGLNPKRKEAIQQIKQLQMEAAAKQNDRLTNFERQLVAEGTPDLTDSVGTWASYIQKNMRLLDSERTSLLDQAGYVSPTYRKQLEADTAPIWDGISSSMTYYDAMEEQRGDR